jgi:pimeloyl-ACP methyl ester carboxylesterase
VDVWQATASNHILVRLHHNGKSKLLTLIVWGREDEVFEPAAFAERFRRLIPHADGPHMATGRHFLRDDSGPEIARLIAAFLARQRGG